MLRIAKEYYGMPRNAKKLGDHRTLWLFWERFLEIAWVKKRRHKITLTVKTKIWIHCKKSST